MVFAGAQTCSLCGGELDYYDRVLRTVRSKNRKVNYIFVRRMKCKKCGSIHREIPKIILPYKHYEKEIIRDVTEELITPDTLGFEDYPCEATMKRWKSQNLQLLL